ncbi:MAG: uncharacterized protein KVP18_005194 [Porospora cf. gigantea A]|uniref:uncharacterized protein n=1 Tax=Porospora cf. gigantea A TaxID=2853593 RepID=UPI003559A012|nr:MAG: hypothetical protein KVP18_005194 [Porospora cf. gigantea A]
MGSYFPCRGLICFQWVDDTAIRKGALQYGQVRAVRILTEERTGMSTGVALVEFTDEVAASKALNDDGSGFQKAAHLPTAPTTSSLPDKAFDALSQNPEQHWGMGGPLLESCDIILESVGLMATTAVDPQPATDKDSLVSQWRTCGLSEIIATILQERKATGDEDRKRKPSSNRSDYRKRRKH